MAGKKQVWVVKAEAIVIHVGKAAERYIYKNAVVPAEVVAEEIKRLSSRGLIEKRDVMDSTVDDAPPASGADRVVTGQTSGAPASGASGSMPAQS